MSNHRVRLFSTAFKEDVVRRLEFWRGLGGGFEGIGDCQEAIV